MAEICSSYGRLNIVSFDAEYTERYFACLAHMDYSIHCIYEMRTGKSQIALLQIGYSSRIKNTLILVKQIS